MTNFVYVSRVNAYVIVVLANMESIYLYNNYSDTASKKWYNTLNCIRISGN